MRPAYNGLETSLEVRAHASELHWGKEEEEEGGSKGAGKESGRVMEGWGTVP